MTIKISLHSPIIPMTPFSLRSDVKALRQIKIHKNPYFYYSIHVKMHYFSSNVYSAQ